MKYKLLGRSGLRVSEICLGTMTFGEEWGYGTDRKGSQQTMEAYANAGGNFLDTANRYTEGTSEKYIGDFLEKQRHDFVLATKYSLYDDPKNVNAAGNHRKNMMRSVEGSLKRLNTDHIDLLWMHIWDFTTPVDEVMRGLDDLVSAGKVHYIGFSDVPAWVLSKAATMAEWRGWAPLVALQVEYSLVERDVEEELLPAARHFGMGITPWSPLGAGILTGKYNDGLPENQRLKKESLKMTDKNLEIARLVSEIAKQVDASPAQTAIAWLLHQGEDIIPIVGAKRADQIEETMKSIDVELSAGQLEQLDKATAIEPRFPHKFYEFPSAKKAVFGDNADRLIRPKVQP